MPLAFVLVFIAGAFQPSLTFGGATIDPADLAILLAVVCALVEVRGGVRPVLVPRALWIAAAVFLAFTTAACFYPLRNDSAYAWHTHLVTDAKFVEYALLGPAVAVLVRDLRELRRLIATAIGLTVAAALVALIQFSDVDIFRYWPPGYNREPSFTGLAELAALGGAALAIGFIGLLWPGSIGRRQVIAALVSGAIALVSSGELAGVVSLGAIVLGALVVVRSSATRRRGVATILGVVVACTIGVFVLREGDVSQFGRFVGVLHPTAATTHDVQTYSQRTLMYYIGLKVFERHILLGAGWQSIREKQVYEPVLPAAHREFPGEPEQAFPAPAHTWAVDDAYIQSLAELGIVGALLFVGMLVTGLWFGVRGVLRAPPDSAPIVFVGLLWLLVSMGIWAGQGLIAGVAFEALPWLGLGLIAAGLAAGRAGRRAQTA